MQVYNIDYLKLIAQRYLRLKDNWKDNPNRYTAIIRLFAPVFSVKQRKELNLRIMQFSLKNYGFSPEGAERIIYNSHQPFMAHLKIYRNIRVNSQSGIFDTINKEIINTQRLEKNLRNLAFWCEVIFKQICKEQKLNFEVDEVGFSDIQTGTKIITA